jgi:hypothetical protein
VDSLYLNYNGSSRQLKVCGVTRNTQKFPSNFFRLAAEGPGEEPQKNERKFLGLLRARHRARPEARHHEIRAYGEVQSHHALGACEARDHSLVSKWVRAKVSISSQQTPEKPPDNRLVVFLVSAVTLGGMILTVTKLFYFAHS